jgi:hypothetical protein
MMDEERAVVRGLVTEFEKLGIDITTEEGRREFRETMTWARTNRARCEKLAGYTILLVVGGIASLVGAWVLSGAQNFFRSGGN